MPRSSAFRRANKAITRTRDFFAYESPYPTAVPDVNEVCPGPCCAGARAAAAAAAATGLGVSTSSGAGAGAGVVVGEPSASKAAREGSPASAMSAPASAASALAAAVAGEHKLTLIGNAEEKTQPKKSLSAEIGGRVKSERPEKSPLEGMSNNKSNKSKSSSNNKGHNNNNQPMPELEDEDEDTANGFCDCETCLTARDAGTHHPCVLRALSAYRASITAHRALLIAQMAGRASKDVGMAIRLVLRKSRKRVVAEVDLRNVVWWAAVKIIKLTVPLGDKALKQLVGTLVESAEKGSKERLNKGRKLKNSATHHTQPDNNLGNQPVQPKTSCSRTENDTSKSLITGADDNRRPRATTKWDLLRGLKCAAEEFLEVGTAMTDKQFSIFVDDSVLKAPNLPTGAYTTLRNDLLAENIGRLLVQLRNVDNKGGSNQFESIRSKCQDPIVTRWRTLKRDFPDIPGMISKLQPERDQIQHWLESGEGFLSASLCIVAADKKSSNAIAQALAGKDIYRGEDDIVAFTKRLAEIDKDARFQIEKPDPANSDQGETRCKELLDLIHEILGRYPGLSMAVGSKWELPYHPDDEESF